MLLGRGSGIFILLAIASLIALAVANRGGGGQRLNGDCLTHESCLKNERCIVSPKGDGFATVGRCGEACDDDLQCSPGFRCDELLVGKTFDAPIGTKGEFDGKAKRCVAGARK